MTISASVFRRKRRGRPARRWTILLTYEDGRRREITGYTDLEATRQKAAQLVRELERKEVGLHDPFATHRRTPLADHLEAFLEAMAAGALGRRRSGRPSAEYVVRARRRLQVVLQRMGGPVRIGGLELEVAERALEDSCRRGWSDKTRDDHAALLRQFGAWLVDSDRAAVNPFHRLRATRTQASTTFRRRALTMLELQQLVDAAEARAVAGYRLANPTARPETMERVRRRGRERGLVYLVTAYTGLRRGEVTSLTWGDLQLGEDPTVTVQAQVAKNRKEQRVALPRWLADELVELRRQRGADLGQPPPAGRLVFRVSYSHLTEQLTKDALYARLGSADARGRCADQSGRVLDFHALRVTYATMLASLGVPEKVATELMRHSDVRLTFETYAQIRPGAARSWVEQLPRPGAESAPPPAAGEKHRRAT